MANRTLTVGDGKTHATLNAALAAEFVANPDLTTAGGICTIECYFTTGGDTTAVSWPAFTNATSVRAGDAADNFIKIVQMVRAGASPNTTTAYWRTLGLTVATRCTEVWGLQSSCTGDVSFTTNNVAWVLFDGCFAKATENDGFAAVNNCPSSVFRNCIAYECGESGFVVASDSGTITLQNCTAVGCGVQVGTFYGFQRAFATMVCTNCLGYGNSDGDFNGTITATYCASADLTADDNGGAGNITGISDPFVALASDNYHITAAAVAVLVGTDLSGSFTTDIDGDTRANWAMGADDGPADEGGSTNVVFCRGRLRW